MKSWSRRFQHGTKGFVCLLLWLASSVFVVAADSPTDKQESTSGEPDLYVSPTNGLGSWIWADTTHDSQLCQLWRAFEIPYGTSVRKARLVMTVDNEFTLYLDGRPLGRGAEWRELFDFDVTALLSPGKHVVAVRGMNSFSFAGMIFGLQVDLADGRSIHVKSDESWRIVPDGVSRWEKRTEARSSWPAATIRTPLGGQPWWTQPVNVNVMPVLEPIRVYFWQRGWFQITLISTCGLVILVSFRLAAQLASHRKERRLLHQERLRIAREIHDDIGSRITQLVLHGEVAQEGLADSSETRQQLGQICDEARALLSGMDEVLWAVNPRRDTLRDFASYVCKYAQQYLKPTAIQCRLEVDPEMDASPLELPLRRSLLMAIKESLNNAVKYSGATELRLQIRWRGERLVVVVVDNGKGFYPETVTPDRNGLTNMAQRMGELGGECRVTSRPGEGCRVEFSIPLRHPGWHNRAWAWTLKPFAAAWEGNGKSPTNETDTRL